MGIIGVSGRRSFIHDQCWAYQTISMRIARYGLGYRFF